MTDDAKWYFDDGVPGVGERPSYLEPKYTSLAQQARAYAEARKELGTLASQLGPAPDSYDISAYTESIESDHPSVQNFLSYAKEKRLPQDVVSKAVETLSEYEKSYQIDETLAPEHEKKRETLDTWAKNTMTKESQEVFNVIPKTSQVIDMLDEIRQSQYRSKTQPPHGFNSSAPAAPLTEKQVRQEMHANKDRYMNDANYRDEIRAKLEQVLGET